MSLQAVKSHISRKILNFCKNIFKNVRASKICQMTAVEIENRLALFHSFFIYFSETVVCYYLGEAKFCLCWS